MMGQTGHLGSEFGKKLSVLKNTILPTIDLNDPEDPAVQMALKDLALILAYLFKHHEEIIQNNDPLDFQMVEIIRKGSLEDLLSTATAASPPATAANDNSQGAAAAPQKKGLFSVLEWSYRKQAIVPTMRSPFFFSQHWAFPLQFWN